MLCRRPCPVGTYAGAMVTSCNGMRSPNNQYPLSISSMFKFWMKAMLSLGNFGHAKGCIYLQSVWSSHMQQVQQAPAQRLPLTLPMPWNRRRHAAPLLNSHMMRYEMNAVPRRALKSGLVQLEIYCKLKYIWSTKSRIPRYFLYLQHMSPYINP